MTRHTVFVDTNILVSGIFFDGPEAELLDTRGIRLVTAEVCKEELKDVSSRKWTSRKAHARCLTALSWI
ncbi:hypothetical protein EGH25_04885 [Haladaptatus sp. F3-133]|jgi:hypothetical protein|uniref:PIN domain-containing protein n=1 Tax=Halorutilus salinus TaxID=2487751 RepID=A0A9Q4C2I7_9EURY|nr:hypothetical protein [Halorutilus salinus]MCX2818685.1 hypothetical protein [Halorutilus salinus]